MHADTHCTQINTTKLFGELNTLDSTPLNSKFNIILLNFVKPYRFILQKNYFIIFKIRFLILHL